MIAPILCGPPEEKGEKWTRRRRKKKKMGVLAERSFSVFPCPAEKQEIEGSTLPEAKKKTDGDKVCGQD